MEITWAFDRVPIIPAIWMVLFLSSCVSGEVLTSEVVSTVEIQPSATTSASVLSTQLMEVTQDPTETGIVVPTRTPIPTPSLLPEIVAASATQQALEEHCPGGRTFGSTVFSPDSRWAAVNCDQDETVFVRLDEKRIWFLNADDLIGYETDFFFVQVFHWSSDGNYAYWGADPHTDGFWEPFHKATNLFRLRLESGEITKVLPSGTNPSEFFAFGFSPDDETLVYIETDNSPVVLRFLDLETGNLQEEVVFTSKYNTGGGFVWSPDGQKFVFSVAQFDETVRDYLAVSIFLWDQVESAATLLVEDFWEFLEPVEWVDESKIILKGWSDDTGELETLIFELDLAGSPKLTPIDP